MFVLVDGIDLVVRQTIGHRELRELTIAKTPQSGIHRADPQIARAVFKDGFHHGTLRGLVQSKVGEFAISKQTKTAVGAEPQSALAALPDAPDVVVSQTILR